MDEGKSTKDIDNLVSTKYAHLYSEAQIIVDFVIANATENVEKVQDTVSKHYGLISDYYHVRALYSSSHNRVDDAEKNFATCMAIIRQYENDTEVRSDIILRKVTEYLMFGKDGGVHKLVQRIGNVYTDLTYRADMPEIIKYYQSKIPEFLP